MKKLLAAIVMAAGLISCVSTNENLGGDMIATNEQYDIYTAEFDLDTVLMKAVDSLSAYSDSRITIGSVRDETFGLMKRGAVVRLVPVMDSIDFGTNPVFQKFRFNAVADTVSYEDANQESILQNVYVYALTEPLSTKDYYSRADIKHSKNRITKGIPVINGQDTLSFNFTADYGKQYLKITQEDMEDFDQYAEKFPGIYITTDDPVGYGGRINMFQMNILDNSGSEMTRTDNYAALYWSAEFDGERRDTMLMFYYSPLEFQDLDSLYEASSTAEQYVFNADYHETDGMIGPAKDKIYVEGGSGLKPVIPATEIKRLINAEIKKRGGDPSTALISKATIELPFEFPDDYTTMFRFPSVLSPTVKISTDTTVTFAGLTDASVSTENQGDINRSLCNYAPDITHHVAQIIKTDDSELSAYDVWFLIMSYETTTTTDSSASELADYYQQLAYYSYYNSLYGGGYGGYSSYGYSGYSNYYSYMMMAQYASASASSTSTSTELDKDRFYKGILNGPTSTGEKPKLRVTFAIPKK